MVILVLFGFLSRSVVLVMTLSIQAYAIQHLEIIVPQTLRYYLPVTGPVLAHPLARSSVSLHLLVLLAPIQRF